MEETAVREVHLKHRFDAPRERVFKAFTHPTLIARWWGPYSFTIPICRLELQPGGALLLVMVAPDGATHPVTGTVHAVRPPEHFVFSTGAFQDGQGNPQLEALHTATFADHEDGTDLGLQIALIKAAPSVQHTWAGVQSSWMQSFEKLAACLLDDCLSLPDSAQ